MSDEVDSFFDNLVRNDPDLIVQIKLARKRLDRSYQRWCPWGRCEISIDPVDNTTVSAIGVIGCGCDNLPGWKSKYYEGLPKPGFAAKPVGRYRGRIERKRRLTAELEAHQEQIRRMFDG
jgi:hypothetical protein